MYALDRGRLSPGAYLRTPADALQAGLLVKQLAEMRVSGTKDAQDRRAALEQVTTELRSFADAAKELRANGSAADIIRGAAKLQARAAQLMETHAVSRDRLAPVAFDPMNIDELTRGGQNLIGRIRRVTDPGKLCRLPLTPRRQ